MTYSAKIFSPDELRRMFDASTDPNRVKLTLWRYKFSANATLGKLMINGAVFCHTLEPTVRPRGARKVPGKTAIPDGEYAVSLTTMSPRFSNFARYPWARICNGRLPRLCNVPGFSGILMHVGNTPLDTEGCILVGEAVAPDMLTNSVATFRRLMLRLQMHPRHLPLYIDVHTCPH